MVDPSSLPCFSLVFLFSPFLHSGSTTVHLLQQPRVGTCLRSAFFSRRTDRTTATALVQYLELGQIWEEKWENWMEIETGRQHTTATATLTCACYFLFSQPLRSLLCSAPFVCFLFLWMNLRGFDSNTDLGEGLVIVLFSWMKAIDLTTPVRAFFGTGSYPIVWEGADLGQQINLFVS